MALPDRRPLEPAAADTDAARPSRRGDRSLAADADLPGARSAQLAARRPRRSTSRRSTPRPRTTTTRRRVRPAAPRWASTRPPRSSRRRSATPTRTTGPCALIVGRPSSTSRGGGLARWYMRAVVPHGAWALPRRRAVQHDLRAVHRYRSEVERLTGGGHARGRDSLLGGMMPTIGDEAFLDAAGDGPPRGVTHRPGRAADRHRHAGRAGSGPAAEQARAPSRSPRSPRGRTRPGPERSFSSSRISVSASS